MKQESTINPEKYYSLQEAAKLTAFKARETVAKYITKGALQAIQTGGEGNTRRYAILGEWIIDFNKRHQDGKLKLLKK